MEYDKMPRYDAGLVSSLISIYCAKPALFSRFGQVHLQLVLT